MPQKLISEIVVVLGWLLLIQVIIRRRVHVNVHDFGIHVHVDIHVHVHCDILGRPLIIILWMVTVMPSRIVSSVGVKMLRVWIEQIVIVDMMIWLLCGLITLY